MPRASSEQMIMYSRVEAFADRDDVVRPPRRKVPRRHFHPRMSSGNAGSSRAGLSR